MIFRKFENLLKTISDDSIQHPKGHPSIPGKSQNFQFFQFWPLYVIYIRHRAEGRFGVTSSVVSSIHSRSSTSFQVQPPASVLRGSRLSLQVELRASSGAVS